MQKLTAQQKKILEKSSHVARTTDSHVVFTEEFKAESLRLFEEGIPSPEIFDRYGLKLEFFKENYYSSNLKRWRKTARETGSLKRGRPRKAASVTIDDLSINDLRALVEIQMGVIEELKKKRALAKKK